LKEQWIQAKPMASVASPLRYPGGKACLFNLAATVLRINGLERAHYAEPYAGGCGLALELLYGGHVADIHINYIDASIWAFWDSVLNDTTALLAKIAETPVTIDEWRRQRDVYRRQSKKNKLELGFSAFFLNRTNRSGIIKGAGVIGGLDQSGNYKIDCRYNFDELTKRIRRINKYKERIHLTNLDAIEFMRLCDKSLPSDSLMFIDPPYYNKGVELYTSFYQDGDHVDLSELVMKLKNPWIMTYDDVDAIRRLYKNRRQYSFDVNYSLQTKRLGTELLIASKNLRMPEAVKERQVNRPQYRAVTQLW
jgi:DNA adenine methylase